MQKFKWEGKSELKIDEVISLLNSRNHYEIIYTPNDHNKYKDIFQVIDNEFDNHKEDVRTLRIEQINSANYEDIIPKGEFSHYHIMRYFIAIGRADAAGKFYVDTFKLPAQDALQYLTELCQ